MSNKTVPLLIASVGGVLAAIGLTRGTQAPATDDASVASIEIFVSVRTIDVAEAITPDKVRLEKWPIDRIPKGASGKLAGFEGKFARQRFYDGEPIMSAKLMDEVTDSAEMIPHGYRVVSLPSHTNRNATSRLRRGDLVDVVAYFTKGNRFAEPTAKTVLSSVRVFAVDGDINREDGFIDIDAKSRRSVSLLIHRKDTPAWTCASELGTIRLPLASPTEVDERGDDTTPSPAATEFLAWLSEQQPARTIGESELMQTAATSSVPTLVSVPSPIAHPTPAELSMPIAVPTPIDAATTEAAEGFKMLKLSGGVQTEYWIEAGTEFPVIVHQSNPEDSWETKRPFSERF